MTERRASSVECSDKVFAIGPSRLVWDGTALNVEINEPTVPLPGRIRGRVRLHPSAFTNAAIELDDKARHCWSPMAPFSRVEVELERPGLNWSGPAYLDHNRGLEPLEAGFKRWDWSRASLSDGTAVLYDVTMRSGERRSLGLLFDHSGQMHEMTPPQSLKLPRTRWLVPRATQADDGEARVLKTLEDTPFYARSLLSTHLWGAPVTAMHESLCLDRFRSPIVRLMLPYRMPRQFW
jgi:carotenoid 1,2-hydratase